VTVLPEHDRSICKHVDAIQALINPDRVLAVFAVEPDGQPYFFAPPGYERLIDAALDGYRGLTETRPTST
jgi:hypothetical protein